MVVSATRDQARSFANRPSFFYEMVPLKGNGGKVAECPEPGGFSLRGPPIANGSTIAWRGAPYTDRGRWARTEGVQTPSSEPSLPRSPRSRGQPSPNGEWTRPYSCRRQIARWRLRPNRQPCYRLRPRFLRRGRTPSSTTRSEAERSRGLKTAGYSRVDIVVRGAMLPPATGWCLQFDCSLRAVLWSTEIGRGPLTTGHLGEPAVSKAFQPDIIEAQ